MIPTITELGTYLRQHVNAGTFVTYSQLCENFVIEMPKDGSQNKLLYYLLGQIVSEDMATNRPLRTSVIVKKSKSKLPPYPNDGYFVTLCAYRHEPFPKTAAAKREMHRRELNALRWGNRGN
jgi:hypothetical protein